MHSHPRAGSRQQSLDPQGPAQRIHSGEALQLGLEDLGSLPDAGELPLAPSTSAAQPLPSAFATAAASSELDDLFGAPASFLPGLRLDRPPSWIPPQVQQASHAASETTGLPVGSVPGLLGSQTVNGGLQAAGSGHQYGGVPAGHQPVWQDLAVGMPQSLPAAAPSMQQQQAYSLAVRRPTLLPMACISQASRDSRLPICLYHLCIHPACTPAEIMHNSAYCTCVPAWAFLQAIVHARS